MAAGNRAQHDLRSDAIEIDKIAIILLSPLAANGSISISETKMLIGILSLLSLGASLLGCLHLMDGSQAYTAGIYVAAIILMLTYDHGPRTKQKGLVGNTAISSLVAAVVLYGASSIEGLGALYAGMLQVLCSLSTWQGRSSKIAKIWKLILIRDKPCQ